MGVQHPNPVVKTMRAAAKAWELSNELELTDVHVFFSDSFSSGWIPYAERGRYLADATIGVSTHHDHVETAFSFRTRILDYFWAGLPVVTTRGDALAEVIERAGAGRTVDPGDVDGLASAINELLDDEAARTSAAAASARLADEYRWSSVAAAVAGVLPQPLPRTRPCRPRNTRRNLGPRPPRPNQKPDHPHRLKTPQVAVAAAFSRVKEFRCIFRGKATKFLHSVREGRSRRRVLRGHWEFVRLV